ncbi:MAG: hypothetical protein R3B40_26420 [Polyangiales bacterium]
MTSRLRHVEGGVSADEGAPASVEHRARRTRHGARGARSRWSAAGLALTALLGPLPVAALAGVCVARFLPVAENTRFTVGITLVIPLWLAGTCRAFLVQRTSRALLACVLSSVALGALAYGVPS